MSQIHFAIRPLLFVAAGLLLIQPLLAQEEFERNIVPTISFSEKRHESTRYVADYEDYERYYDTATVSISARASMQGVDLDTIGPETEVGLNLGSFSFTAELGDSPTYEAGDRTITFKFDADGDDTEESSVVVRYDATAVNFTVTVSRDIDANYSPVASGLEGSEYEANEYKDVTTGGFRFADRALTERSVYVVGTRVAIYSRRVGAGTDLDQTFEDLADVVVSGESDSDGPKVAIPEPKENLVVREPVFDVVVTAIDPREVVTVQVQVNDGDWENATRQSDGTWTLPVELTKGGNVIVAQAVDIDGNPTISSTRRVRFAPLTTLTVNAAGTGAGSVTAAYFAALPYVPGQASPVRTATEEEDKELTLTATASAGSVFDGWTSNAPLTPGQAASPVLRVILVPGLTLTAHFLPNPFLSTLGVYSGLIASNPGGPQGFLSLKLDAKGAFTGQVRIGTLTLAIRGKFSNTGNFTGQVISGGVTYAVTLNLAAASSGGRQVVGSVSGGAVNATLTGDRLEFNKTTPAPQAGVYNLVLAPDADNTDTDYPAGYGFGRVTVGKTGLARFTGKLGDGTALNFGTSLSKSGGWPFFAPLYSRKGSISGVITFANRAATDLTGTLDWFKPAGLKSQVRFAGGFRGRSEVGGVKFPGPPAKGTRLILQADGEGSLFLDASAAAIKTGVLPPISSEDDVVLGTDHKLQIAADARLLKFTIAPATGLFSGSFVTTVNGKPLTTIFSGAVIPPKGTFAGSAAGHFLWGDRTGAVSLTAPE